MKLCLNVLLVAVSIPIVAISAGKRVAIAAGDLDNAAADLQVIKRRLVEMVLAPPSPARAGEVKTSADGAPTIRPRSNA